MSKTGNDEHVVFAHIGGIRQLHPFEGASEALAELLPTTNEQLNMQGRERSLLIINTGISPHGAVAVGTILTDRPPHRSVRARLRIRLL